MKINTRRSSAKLAVLTAVLITLSVQSAQAMEWCSRRRSSNVIDCRSGTCVPMPGGEPTWWEVVKCEWNEFWD